MTPAFAQRSVFCTLATRATICPLPLSCWWTNWKASAAPQMSAPDPLTLNVPFVSVELPAIPTVPMSWSVQVDATVVDVVLDDVVVVGIVLVVDDLVVEVEEVVTAEDVVLDEEVVYVAVVVLLVVVVGTVVVVDLVVEVEEVVDVEVVELVVVLVVVVVAMVVVVVGGVPPPFSETPSSVAVVTSVLSCAVAGRPT